MKSQMANMNFYASAHTESTWSWTEKWKPDAERTSKPHFVACLASKTGYQWRFRQVFLGLQSRKTSFFIFSKLHLALT